MLLGTLDSSLWKKLLTVKGVKTKIPRWGVITAGKRTIKVGQDF